MKLAYRDPNYTEFMTNQWEFKLFGRKLVIMTFKRVNEKPFDFKAFGSITAENKIDDHGVII